MLRTRFPVLARLLAAAAPERQLRGYVQIIGLFLALLATSLAASWEAIDVVNSTRAYATGEARYSKAEKMAVINLYRYAYGGNQAAYREFLDAVSVPLGDHAARSELERSSPNFDIVRKGLLAGENNAQDLDGIVRLYRRFSWWAPFAAAVADWRTGDQLVARLVRDGTVLHSRLSAHTASPAERSRLLANVRATDDAMSALENQFATHLGEAARAATLLVALGLAATITLLWAAGILLAARLLGRQFLLDRKLTSEEQRFRDFADVATDWYWEVDAAGRVTYMSDRFFSTLGLARSAVLNADGLDFIQRSAINRKDRDAYDISLAGRKPFNDVRVQLQGERQTLYWSISGKPRFDVFGRYEGYRGVATDITKLMRDAQSLRESKERAEIANRAKSEFLANMSHELRTPLNAVLGFSEIIAGRLLGPHAIDRYAGYASDIHASGAHLLSIINDILDLSKIEAGHAEIVDDEVRLDEFARSLRTLLEGRFIDSGVAFTIEICDPVPVIMADRRKMTQILVNLLSNAAKFTPAGGRVTLAAQSDADGGLSIAVRDTGIGIAPEHIEIVLSPFGQIESAFSRQHHGTGLGLPLSKSLAELHGGSLSIDSAPGKGTTVTVKVPPSRVLIPAQPQSIRRAASA